MHQLCFDMLCSPLCRQDRRSGDLDIRTPSSVLAPFVAMPFVSTSVLAPSSLVVRPGAPVASCCQLLDLFSKFHFSVKRNIRAVSGVETSFVTRETSRSRRPAALVLLAMSASLFAQRFVIRTARLASYLPVSLCYVLLFSSRWELEAISRPSLVGVLFRTVFMAYRFQLRFAPSLSA